MQSVIADPSISHLLGVISFPFPGTGGMEISAHILENLAYRLPRRIPAIRDTAGQLGESLTLNSYHHICNVNSQIGSLILNLQIGESFHRIRSLSGVGRLSGWSHTAGTMEGWPFLFMMAWPFSPSTYSMKAIASSGLAVFLGMVTP